VEALLEKWLSGPGFFTGSREVKRQDILLKNLPAEQKSRLPAIFRPPK
jgi:hypothetical protein